MKSHSTWGSRYNADSDSVGLGPGLRLLNCSWAISVLPVLEPVLCHQQGLPRPLPYAPVAKRSKWPLEPVRLRSRLELAGNSSRLRQLRLRPFFRSTGCNPRGARSLSSDSRNLLCGDTEVPAPRSLGIGVPGHYFSACGSVGTGLPVRPPEGHLKGCILHEKEGFEAK